MAITGHILIMYVQDQDKSTMFYTRVLGIEPQLYVPGMTEFALIGRRRIGLDARRRDQAFARAIPCLIRCGRLALPVLNSTCAWRMRLVITNAPLSRVPRNSVGWNCVIGGSG